MKQNNPQLEVPDYLAADLSLTESSVLKRVSSGGTITAIKQRALGNQCDDNSPRPDAIRASFFLWLLTDKSAKKSLHPSGIRVDGAHIEDRLDLSSSVISVDVSLVNCDFPNGINLSHANIRNFVLNGSSIHLLQARYLSASGSVVLRKAEIYGECTFQSARMEDLDCIGSTFRNLGKTALDADRLRIRGAIFLNHIIVEGCVVLSGASFAATLDLAHAQIANPNAVGLFADRLVGGSINIEHAAIDGDVRFLGAKISALFFQDSELKAGVQYALSADSACVDGPIYLRKLVVEGGINFLRASTSANFECSNSIIKAKDGKAFVGDGIVSGGSLTFRESLIEGEVRLLGAEINGDLNCMSSTIKNAQEFNLNADAVEVKGVIDLRSLQSVGEIRLVGATASSLDCDRSNLHNEDRIALNGESMLIRGPIFLRDAEFLGEIRLSSVEASSLWFTGSELRNPAGFAIIAEKSLFKKNICLRSLETRPLGKVNLMFSKTFALLDDKTSWPIHPNVLINGFEYDVLGADKPPVLTERLQWLKCQPNENYLSQPFDQLAKVFKQAGLEEGSREILIQSQKNRRKIAKLNTPTKLKLWFLEHTIRYGYDPSLAVLWAVLVVSIGFLIFTIADQHGVMISSKPGVENPFNSFVYSLDVFLPIINLEQQAYWLPYGDSRLSLIARCYFWLEIILGWTVSTILVAALTGIMRNK